MRLRVNFFIIAFLILSGCAADTSFIEKGGPPQINQDERLYYEQEYKIKPKDILNIKVYPGEEFKDPLQVEVNTDGGISIPLLNKVTVTGLTVVEAENKVAELLDRDFIVNPSVSIRIEKYHERTVVVLGEVKRPGAYDFPESGRLTVMQAVALAGGFSDIAAIDRVRLIRRIKGEQKTFEINMEDIINGKAEDITVLPDDVINVPESFF